MTEMQDASVFNAETGIELEHNRPENLVEEKAPHKTTIEITGLREEYPVGFNACFVVGVTCQEKCSLSGGTILIGDIDDYILAEQTLNNFDSCTGLNTTDSFYVKIPEIPGNHSFTVIYFPLGTGTDTNNMSGSDSIKEEAELFKLNSQIVSLHSITQTEFSFEANPHTTSVLAWRDELVPVPVGSEYLLHVGINCFEGCSLYGQKVNIYQDDVFISTVEVLEPAAKRRGYYHNEVTLVAPAEVGMYTLEFRFQPEESDLSHNAKPCQFFLTTTLKPQCRLDLTAINVDDNTPVEYANFFVQPKEGFPGQVQANSMGKASMNVCWGEHKIYATREDYQAVFREILIPEGQEVFEMTFAMSYFCAFY